MDKESTAVLQNKRQEFRYNQVMKAVNKERDLRERELSYESNQFKARLQKLIDKRKELNLDPAKTRQLELLLVPRLKKKSRGTSPERKISLPSFKVTDDTGNDVFLTNINHPTKNIVANNYEDINLLQKVNHRTSADQIDNDCDENANALEGQEEKRSMKQENIVTGLMKDDDDKGGDSSDILRDDSPQSCEQGTRKISQNSGRGIQPQPVRDNMKQTRAYRKSSSEFQAKLENVQQWLSDLESDAKSTEGKAKQCKKRHSFSS